MAYLLGGKIEQRVREERDRKFGMKLITGSDGPKYGI